MSAVARLLTVMGSGETAPTMVKAHRAVLERLGKGPGPVRGVLLDTPFGFQTNAEELSARAVAYFRESVGAELEVAGLRRRRDLDGPGGDAVLAKVAAAPFVFAGPGSPTYALEQWRGTLVPSLLAEKLALGGAVTFASAAALTLGALTVPVYEIYKVGAEPEWVEGLDLLGALGLRVALVPHYDNAEGGTHDTRYCYLGEERLRRLETELPEDTFVLGVDEHTALMIDLGRSQVAVVGRGAVTVRVQGRSERVEAGAELALEDLVALGAGLAGGGGSLAALSVASPGVAEVGSREATARRVPGASPLLEAVRALEARFEAARVAADAAQMSEVVLELEAELWAWRADTLQSDEADRARAALRAMVGTLGEVAVLGTRDPAEVLRPYVELALFLRDEARRERRFAEADSVRDRLVALGVEVRDGPEGSSWVLAPDGAATRGDPRGSW